MKHGVRQKQKQPKNFSVSLTNKTAQTKNEKFPLVVLSYTVFRAEKYLKALKNVILTPELDFLVCFNKDSDEETSSQ